jgi:hypothetical protein
MPRKITLDSILKCRPIGNVRRKIFSATDLGLRRFVARPFVLHEGEGYAKNIHLHGTRESRDSVKQLILLGDFALLGDFEGLCNRLQLPLLPARSLQVI